MSLFTTGLARRSDPSTSHAAARELVESGRLSKDAEFALSMVALYPGRTAAELEIRAFCKDGKCRKRLAGLRAAKKVDVGTPRKCSVTNRMCQTWWPVAAERRAS